MKIELYTSSWCPFCVRAKALLDGRGLEYTEHVMDGRDGDLAQVKRKYNHHTVPIVLVDDEMIGGSDELHQLAASGRLG